MRKYNFLTLVLSLAFFVSTAQDKLDRRDFKTPPQTVQVHTWWHWINGNITKEGITKDLESMKQQGISQAEFRIGRSQTIGALDELRMAQKWDRPALLIAACKNHLRLYQARAVLRGQLHKIIDVNAGDHGDRIALHIANHAERGQAVFFVSEIRQIIDNQHSS